MLSTRNVVVIRHVNQTVACRQPMFVFKCAFLDVFAKLAIPKITAECAFQIKSAPHFSNLLNVSANQTQSTLLILLLLAPLYLHVMKMGTFLLNSVMARLDIAGVPIEMELKLKIRKLEETPSVHDVCERNIY